MVKQDDLDLYLTTDDVRQDPVITFLDEGEYQERTFNQQTKKIFRINVKLGSGEKRVWTPNLTARRTIARAWGDDSDSWVGRSVKLGVTNVNVHGEVKESIYVVECLDVRGPD